ncbi:type II secretion system protein [Photobacterium rosenbergii]|uniref:type II secretion system protein n=1 Tax=Photobacterium rosenbergii TaxID=294936 RepID=UPI001C994ED1|nr:prepilin-type N-terminal cleavage/methylation domain-containing protein [Photobacterium rosenbergii]MBY5947376.1 prepilin-type N-terminal cleavage/methylation domain-containing protein [Photobacterium rosenbergii]
MRINRGFGLIEVLVASVILVSLLAAVLPLFDAGNTQMQRVEQVELLLSAKKRIYNRLAALNPAQQNTGNGSDNGYGYRWLAERKTEFRPQYAPEANEVHDLALFEVTVAIFQADNPDKTIDSFSFNIIGWTE